MDVLKMSGKICLVALVLSTAFFFGMTAGSTAFAAEEEADSVYGQTDPGQTPAAEIAVAETEEEFIAEIETPEDPGLIAVDKETGKIGEADFEEVFGVEVKPGEEIPQAVEDTGLFEITGETEEEYIATPLFEGKQILVEDEVTDAHGAEKAVSYDGETVLTFADAETTRNAYDELVEEYDEEKVIVDVPIHVEDVKGWGTTYMNIPSKRRKSADAGIKTKVTVAVIDSGIQRSHKVFSGRTILGSSKSFIDGSISDLNGHGTAVTGIIAESTPKQVRFMVLKVIDRNGSGSLLKMLAAIDYAQKNGADVINLSVGVNLGSAFRGYVDRRLKALSEKSNVVMVSSAGNEGSYSPYGYPAACPYVISVSSVGKNGKISSFSNYAGHVEFCAPGENVLCAKKGTSSGYTVKSGTSLSCPYIAASCALIKMVKKSLDLNGMRYHLKCIAIDRGSKGKDQRYGWGMPRFGSYKKQITASMVTVSSAVRYKGKGTKPKVTVTDKGCRCRIKSYKVIYPKNWASYGRHKIKIKGIKGYRGTVTKTFKTVPRKPAIKVESGRRSIGVAWSKTASRVQVQVWKSRSSKSKPVINIVHKGWNYKKLTGLKKNKRYWVRVRTYEKVRGKYYCSPWSEWRRCYAR